MIKKVQYAQQLEPQNVWFTHICHDNSHEQIEQFVHDNLNLFPKLKKIAENGGSVGPAWDGLEISAGEWKSSKEKRRPISSVIFKFISAATQHVA